MPGIIFLQVSELNQDMTDEWLDSCLELTVRYADWIKRAKVLLDYFDVIVQNQRLTDSKQARMAQLILQHCDWGLSYAVAAKKSDAVNELRSLIKQRISTAASCAELAAGVQTGHPLVAKFLAHLRELFCDFEFEIRFKEIALGREMDETKDKVGGPARFRRLLETECDWLPWNEAERLISNALDSPSSARWDAIGEEIKAEIGDIWNGEGN